MISIIIPHYSKDDLTNQLINSLYQHCSGHEIQIIVIDDGSPNPFPMNEKYTVHRVDGNMGFLFASKLGLYVSQGDIKILINNDVIVSGDFIPMVERQIQDNEMSLVGNRLIGYKTGWNDFGDKIFPYLEGYFLAASAKFWEEIDFDVQFAPNDMEDVDLSTTAYSKFYPVIALNTPFLKHIGAQTYGFSPAREAVTKKNKELFRLKWCPTFINVEARR